jgi:hypothetical protein
MCDLSHCFSKSLTQSVSPPMILSHYSTRILRLSLCLSIYHLQSVMLSFTINGSISPSIDDPSTLFYRNHLPAIHEIDQSKRSITLSINLSSTVWWITLSFRMNGSISQSSDDPFTLFSANSLPVVHKIDQSKKLITPSVNLSSAVWSVTLAFKINDSPHCNMSVKMVIFLQCLPWIFWETIDFLPLAIVRLIRCSQSCVWVTPRSTSWKISVNVIAIF